MSRPQTDACALTFTPPCLASPRATPPDGEDWLHEIKFDGYRIQALIDDGRVRILTRTGLDWTGRFGDLARGLSELPVSSAALDGEAVVLDAEGRSRFGLLQAAMRARGRNDVTMMAFDLLHLDGLRIADQPLRQRKARLKGLLVGRRTKVASVRYVDHVVAAGEATFAQACAMGLEGIVSKRADRPYRSGRHHDWTKAKCVRSDPFVVAGYTTQKGKSGMIGALVLGFYERDRLVYAGRVGTGFDNVEARVLAEGLEEIRTRAPAFTTPLDRAQRVGVCWIEPKLVVQVAWRDVTSDGLLRHAAFQHVRHDKPAREIERPDAFA